MITITSYFIQTDHLRQYHDSTLVVSYHFLRSDTEDNKAIHGEDNKK